MLLLVAVAAHLPMKILPSSATGCHHPDQFLVSHEADISDFISSCLRSQAAEWCASGRTHQLQRFNHESLINGRSQSSRFGTRNIHASGNATAAATADIMNAFRYPPIAAWR